MPLGKSWASRLRLALVWLMLLPLTLLYHASWGATDLTIYDEALAPGWQNWSWASVDSASTANPYTGQVSMAVTATEWSAVYLRSADAPVDTHGYLNLTFWVNGGETGGQTIQVAAVLGEIGQPAVQVATLAANTWQKVSVPLASLNADDRNVDGFWIQEGAGVNQPTFYIDNIVLESGVPPTPPPPVNGMSIYGDALVNGWQNWSWATVNTSQTTTVHTGSSAIAVVAGPYAALYLHHDALPTDAYATLTFWINGGATGGQTLNVIGLRNDVAQPAVNVGPLAANTWQEVSIPLAQLGIANAADLTGLWLQENAGADQPTFYVDDVALEFAPPPSVVNVSVEPKQWIRRTDPRMFGLNAAVWDGAYYSPNTTQLLTELDNRALRFPGGSLSDVYHWATNMSEGQTFEWATSFDEFAEIAVKTHANVYITANYGTGTPQEAAAWVRYSNKIKRYNFKYWEIGNENYGTWEADNNVRPHDPVTYATRFKEYYRQMKAVDPTIKIGAVVAKGEDSEVTYTDQPVVNPRTGVSHNGWTPVMLATLKKLGVTPDFVIYHRYEQGPGGESDIFLLNSSASWPADAANIRQMVNDYLGFRGRGVELACTENNSVYGSPGKQTTSLVNGLFFADSLGNLMQTEFNSMLWWDLRNGQEAGNNNGASLYGWRRYGDYGIVSSADPAGPADRYPTFYVYKLLKNFARGGELVVHAESDYNGLGVYAVRGRDDSLRVLLINKHPTAVLNASVSIPALRAGEKATVFTYGIAQDEAARTGVDSADVQQSLITLSGKTLKYSAEPYSATVIQLRPRRTHGPGGPAERNSEPDEWGDSGEDE